MIQSRTNSSWMRLCPLVLVILGVALLIQQPAGAVPVNVVGNQPATSIFEHGATAAIAVDLTTGLELYSYNADTPLPPASTMKIVTAIVAKRVLSLDEQITVEDSDLLDPEEFSVMGLMAGDVITVRALLYGLLMQSGGDAALTLARAGGLALDPSTPNPIEHFVAELNAFAIEIGMEQTHFANPLGADEPGPQQSSARDLVRATEVLLNDWLLARIVSAEYAMVDVGGPSPRAIELGTTNLLLSRSDVFGVKTGTEDAAGECLITGFWRGDNQIITVVLGSQDRYADTQSLMDEVDGRYRWVALGIGTQSAGATETLSEQGLEFMIRRTVVMTVEQSEQLVWEFVEKESAAGDYSGLVRFSVAGREVARLPVY